MANNVRNIWLSSVMITYCLKMLSVPITIALMASTKSASADVLMSGRIQSGMPTELTGWEFMASIQIDLNHPRSPPSRWYPVSSGTILSPTWILISCRGSRILKAFKDAIFMILVGSNHRNVTHSGQRRLWSGICIPHPHCKTATNYYNQLSGAIFDYAVIKVEPAFKMNEDVKHILLASWNHRTFELMINNALKQSTICEVVGWGETSVQFPGDYRDPSEVLLKMPLQLLTWEDCVKRMCYGQKDRPYCSSAVLLTGKICAIPVNPGNTCEGDVGSPLVCGGRVIAILSHVNSCGEYKEPNFYARLDIALDFIEKFVDVKRGAFTVHGDLKIIALLLLFIYIN